MVFTSSGFLIFFVCLYPLFLAVKDHIKIRNLVLLLASYYFYSLTNIMFVAILVVVSAMDFVLAQAIEKSDSKFWRNRLCFLSIAFNLSLLIVFKIEFFQPYLVVLFPKLADPSMSSDVTKMIIPVGISFYTFESMSYIIDVHQNRLKAVTNYFDYALFIAFFPHLVAGPIIRPSHFLPSIKTKTDVSEERFWRAVFRFCIGVCKKILIADALAATVVDNVFANPLQFSSLELLIAAYAYAMQIYFDFSAYSDMAIGLADLLGIKLPENFNSPYSALNIKDFWRRWHISLSTWLRDYLYIPLGGGKKGARSKYINLFITMLLGGIWHGQTLTFVIWGAYHGVLLCLNHLLDDSGIKVFTLDSKITRIMRRILTFHLVAFGWLIFRSSNFLQLKNYLAALCRFTTPQHLSLVYVSMPILMLAALALNLSHKDLKIKFADSLSLQNLWMKTAILVPVICLILIFENTYKPFIYFQF